MSLEPLLARARQSGARLLLAGGDPPALAAVAAELASAEIPGVQVVGNGGLEPESDPRHLAVAELLRARAPERVRDGIHALDLAADPLRFAAGLLALEEAEAVVAGPGVPARTLADLARWTLGPSDGGSPVAAAVCLLAEDGAVVVCADCGLAGPLGTRDRAGLARAAAAMQALVGGETTRIAFLANPGGEAQAAEALAQFQGAAPGVEAGADGSARFRGRVNVLIFPDGAAGYLAVRTARALGGARLLGPLLLGPSRVMAGAAPDAELDELTGTAVAALLAAGRTNR